MYLFRSRFLAECDAGVRSDRAPVFSVALSATLSVGPPHSLRSLENGECKFQFKAKFSNTSLKDIQDEEEVISPATPIIRNLQKLHGHMW